LKPSSANVFVELDRDLHPALGGVLECLQGAVVDSYFKLCRMPADTSAANADRSGRLTADM
jgi:hypothetical protein